MKERNGKMSFDYIAEKWAEALNAIYKEKLSREELYNFFSEMGVPYYVILANWISKRGFTTEDLDRGIRVYYVTDRITKGEIFPHAKQLVLQQRAGHRMYNKTKRIVEQKREAGIKWSDLNQAASYPSRKPHFSKLHLNFADATDSQLVEELRKRGFEVIAKKVTVVEL